MCRYGVAMMLGGRRSPVRAALVAAMASGMLMLAACAPEGGTASPSSGTSPSGTPTTTGTASPSPSPSATASASVPTDCRAILSETVLAELDGTPLNDPATGVATGVQPDGSLVCLWRDPGADTTMLQTTIATMNRGLALDMLNALADTEGFTCYTPEGGTRCEKTWPNPQYPVTDGRTLFWRDDILIDTQFSNLAPAGYTDSIVAHVFGP